MNQVCAPYVIMRKYNVNGLLAPFGKGDVIRITLSQHNIQARNSSYFTFLIQNDPGTESLYFSSNGSFAYIACA
jgi:hypothetical protein